MSFRLSLGLEPRTQHYFYVLIDETDLPNGWKALVAAIPSQYLDLIPQHQLQAMDANLANSTSNDKTTEQGETQ